MKAILLVTIVLVLGVPAARADWHAGMVTAVKVGYDGTITFNISGLTRSNCTCYATWPTDVCLNRARTTSFKEEVAMLYSVRARGSTLSINIDEVTCSVVAMYESG
jgi:hypothetical protein